MIDEQTRRSFVATLVAASAAMAFAVRPSNAADPTTHVVEITGFKFEPETLEVKAGDTITWINRDIAPHTATSKDKSWDTGRLSKDQEKSIIVAADTEQAYYSKLHPVMKAQLVIKG